MPKEIPDHGWLNRQLWLQSLQPGRPFDVPVDHLVTQQSDFESSAIWRAVMLAAVVVIASALFSPASHAAMVVTRQLVV